MISPKPALLITLLPIINYAKEIIIILLHNDHRWMMMMMMMNMNVNNQSLLCRIS